MKNQLQKKILWSWASSLFYGSSLITLIMSFLYFWNLQMWPNNPFAWIFLWIYSFGHFGILGILAFLPFLLFVWLCSFFSLQRWMTPTLLAFCQLILFIDTFVYAQYRFHINPLVIDFLIHGESAIFNFSKSMWIILASVAVFLLLINVFLSEWVFRLLRIQSIPIKKISSTVFISILFGFILSHLIHAQADANSYLPVTQLARVFPLVTPGRFHENMNPSYLPNLLPRSKSNNIRFNGTNDTIIVH